MPYICPDCGAVSHNPTDLAVGYCGRCKAFTSGHTRVLRDRLDRLIAELQDEEPQHDARTCVICLRNRAMRPLLAPPREGRLRRWWRTTWEREGFNRQGRWS